MKDKNFKEHCDRAAAHSQITKAEELIAALPDLIALDLAMKSMSACIATGRKVKEKLNAMCSAYVLKHPGCFDDGLKEIEKSVLVGDITIKNDVYHFSAGYDGFIRKSGNNRSQDFLSTLPEDWVKAKFELDLTGIRRSGATNEELEAKDLIPKENNVWSLKPAE